jgi:hypothetical protein
METGFEHCNGCVTAFDCGTPSSNKSLLVCDGPPSSHDLFVALYDCICGQDEISGACGPVCGKTCTAKGNDTAACQQCLGAALTGPKCGAQYQKCAVDK